MLLAATPSFAARVTLSEDWRANCWRSYPKSVGVPHAEWRGDQFLVDVMVNWTSASGKIDARAVTAKLEGDAIRLCYRWAVRPHAEVGALAPVRLVFTVSDLPRRAYTVSVTENC